MFRFLHSTPRTVHDYNDHQDEHNNKDIHVDETSLTVWRKSLVFCCCSGYTVFGSDGNLEYRVDNYVERPDETVLMDGCGEPIFTISRGKKRWLVDSCWHAYEGETNRTKPLFCMRKNNNTNICRAKSSVLAYVYYCEFLGDERPACRYTIEGSYTNRSCKVLDDSRRVVAEIKKKETKQQGATFGLEVFDLVVKYGFEPRFAMVIVLLLDRMFPL